MATDPVVTVRVSPEIKNRIKQLSERDSVPTSDVVRDCIKMAIDAREAWQRPKVERPEPPTL